MNVMKGVGVVGIVLGQRRVFLDLGGEFQTVNYNADEQGESQ